MTDVQVFRADVTTGQPFTGDAPESHVALYVNFREVTCDTLAELSIRGGRSDHLAEGDAATVAFTLAWPPEMAPPVFGDRVDIVGWLPDRPDTTAALFTGHITDIAIEDEWFSVVAVDPLRRLTGVNVGGQTYPPETAWARAQRVWEETIAAAPGEVWLHDWAYLWAQQFTPPSPGWARQLDDKDTRPALTMFRDVIGPVLGDIYYRPDASWPAPSDPGAWEPDARMRLGVQVHAGGSAPRVHVDCSLIVGNPPPRFWQNMGIVVNEWVIKSTEKQLHGGNWTTIEHAHIARAAYNLRQQYGLRSSTMDTDLQFNDPHNQPYPDIDNLAQALLKRTQVPDWSLDNVQVAFLRDVLDGVSRNLVDHAWTVVAHGAGQLARYATLGPGIPGTAVQAFDPQSHTAWMIEQTQIDWDTDGWVVTLALSPASVYDGTVLDQRVLVADRLPVAVPTAGTTIGVKVVLPYNRRQDTSGTVGVVPGGARVTPTKDGWALVTVPPQTAGSHSLSITWESGSTLQAAPLAWTTAAYDSLHWDEVPAARTWATVPAAAIWRHALAVDDIGGP